MRHPLNRGERKAAQVKLARRLTTIEERAPRTRAQQIIKARYEMTRNVERYPSAWERGEK